MGACVPVRVHAYARARVCVRAFVHMCARVSAPRACRCRLFLATLCTCSRPPASVRERGSAFVRVCARVCVYARACTRVACMRVRVRACVYARACTRVRVRAHASACCTLVRVHACAPARARAARRDARVCVYSDTCTRRCHHRCSELKVQKDRYEFRTDEESRAQRARVHAEEASTAPYPLYPHRILLISFVVAYYTYRCMPSSTLTCTP
eukprot:3936173-Pleurochrysis_carterae.AAC.1